MKKVFSKWCVIASCICIVGFAIGFVYHDKIVSDVNASDKDKRDVEREMKDYCTDRFPDDMYTATYNDNSKFVHITKKNISSKENRQEVYSREDVKSLANDILAPKGELKLINTTEYAMTYEEYKDGYPTGGLASYIFDEDGNVVEARFREGTIYDVDEDDMISYEEAYDIGVKALLEKYGEDTEIDGTSKDYEYNIFYNPELEELCYEIVKVTGHMPSMIASEIDPVYFNLFVSLDGTFVNVASSLGY